MVDLQEYEDYWNGIRERIPEIKKVIPATFEPDMGNLVQGLKPDELPALFFIIPNAQGKSRDVDNSSESNPCVILIMDKTDPQRKKAYQVQKETQLVEKKKKNRFKRIRRPDAIYLGIWIYPVCQQSRKPVSMQSLPVGV